MIKRYILKTIGKHLEKKTEEIRRFIKVLNGLLEEARECKNKPYEEDILKSIQHHEGRINKIEEIMMMLE